MIWSQENCLIDDHRLTYERWEGDLSFWIYMSLFRNAEKAHFYQIHKTYFKEEKE